MPFGRHQNHARPHCAPPMEMVYPQPVPVYSDPGASCGPSYQGGFQYSTHTPEKLKKTLPSNVAVREVEAPETDTHKGKQLIVTVPTGKEPGFLFYGQYGSGTLSLDNDALVVGRERKGPSGDAISVERRSTMLNNQPAYEYVITFKKHLGEEDTKKVALQIDGIQYELKASTTQPKIDRAINKALQEAVKEAGIPPSATNVSFGKPLRTFGELLQALSLPKVKYGMNAVGRTYTNARFSLDILRDSDLNDLPQGVMITPTVRIEAKEEATRVRELASKHGVGKTTYAQVTTPEGNTNFYSVTLVTSDTMVVDLHVRKDSNPISPIVGHARMVLQFQGEGEWKGVYLDGDPSSNLPEGSKPLKPREGWKNPNSSIPGTVAVHLDNIEKLSATLPTGPKTARPVPEGFGAVKESDFRFLPKSAMISPTHEVKGQDQANRVFELAQATEQKSMTCQSGDKFYSVRVVDKDHFIVDLIQRKDSNLNSEITGRAQMLFRRDENGKWQGVYLDELGSSKEPVGSRPLKVRTDWDNTASFIPATVVQHLETIQNRDLKKVEPPPIPPAAGTGPILTAPIID